MFKKYMHVEKFGTEEVLGIELGEAYIFPKLDGTNSSLWQGDDMCLHAGSRNREISSLDNDNQEFFARSLDKWDIYMSFFGKHPNLRLYGEWLVPHTLKTYRDDAWRKFWIFDVYNDDSESYLSYDAYKPLLDAHGLDYIPPLAIVKNGSYEHFVHVLQQNNFFIQDGKGVGEGIVIKNYDFYNKFGNQVWAKIITSEFKEAHHREMGAPETEKRMVEEAIAQRYTTEALCTKVKAKIMNDEGGWRSEYIPRLLNTVFYDIIKEELWEALKEHKFPTINFQTLKHFVFKQVKLQLSEVF